MDSEVESAAYKKKKKKKKKKSYLLSGIGVVRLEAGHHRLLDLLERRVDVDQVVVVSRVGDGISDSLYNRRMRTHCRCSSKRSPPFCDASSRLRRSSSSRLSRMASSSSSSPPLRCPRFASASADAFDAAIAAARSRSVPLSAKRQRQTTSTSKAR